MLHQSTAPCQRRDAGITALSIVMPVLNEAETLPATLAELQPMRRRGAELILVDGGSGDDSRLLAAPLVDLILTAPKGRARQMRAGAARASGRVLWFLHADIRVPGQADRAILAAVAGGAEWGWFDLSLSGNRPTLRMVAWLMNRRARLSRIATGDQGLFVTRAAYRAVGGFPELPLMEDLGMSQRLKRRAGAPTVLAGPLLASSRRWEAHGVWRTITLMWWLRLCFWLGADPAWLERVYYGRGK